MSDAVVVSAWLKKYAGSSVGWEHQDKKKKEKKKKEEEEKKKR
jgi:hypothetical protein